VNNCKDKGRMLEILIFGYSPRHVFLLQTIVNRLAGNSVKIVGPDKFINQVLSTDLHVKANRVDTIILKPVTKEVSPFRRLLNNCVNLMKVIGLKPDVLVTANEHALPSILHTNRSKLREIIVIDEGDFDIILAKEKQMTRYSYSFAFKNLILGIRPRLTDERISSIITASKVVYREFPDKVIKPIASKVRHSLELSKKSVLILSSPLSENHNSLFWGQENQILRKVILQNPDLTFFLRTHYREAEDKYDDLNDLKNFQRFRAFSDEPFDNLDVSCEYVVGFHSSALFSNHLRCKKVISLSAHVGSLHSKSILNQLAERKIEILKEDCIIK
jgi:hypothetical protein